MKILSWNCGGGFRRKFHLLDRYDADILIVQECENPALHEKKFAAWNRNSIWLGEKHKGIAIFSKKHILVEKLDWHPNNFQLFLPCRINNHFNLLAVWTKRGLSHQDRYIGQLWGYLQTHKSTLENSPGMVCGDFNSSALWDYKRSKGSHSDVVRELENAGLLSVYHHQFKQVQGKETSPTFFLQRNSQKPYHIDYAFISRQLFTEAINIEIGEKSDWLAHSDHMPVLVNL